MATNPSKRLKISSSRCLKIIYPQNKDNFRSRGDNIRKRPRSPVSNESKKMVIKTKEFTERVYANPEGVLQEIYENVARKLDDEKLNLIPKYTIVKVQDSFRTWCCAYELKWPKNVEFKKTAPTKQKACREAALTVLMWLRENDTITKDGEAIPFMAPKNEVYDDKLELYGTPKHVLGNTFNQISTKLKNKDLRLKPTFNIIQKHNTIQWSCKYNLKWPELKEIEEIASTKREASEEAALSSLLWLKNNAKITETGRPILNNVESKPSNPTRIRLDHDTRGKIRAIISEYGKVLLPKVESSNDFEPHLTETDETPGYRNVKQRYLGFNKYLAKEKHPSPISTHKDRIMDLIKNNRVVVIKGEPGCGKSTCVPQYALETWIKETNSHADPFRIAVTQPRRIAAVSLAQYVSSERDEECGHIVGYQIRLNRNFNQATGRILYCTNGILLRYLQSDLTLESFPFVILDEAHERDANTDLLMKLLRKSLALNSRLKVIIMSATIDTDLFSNYFHRAPVFVIDGCAYPVQTHFLDDLLELDLNKTKTISQSLTPSIVYDDVVKVIMYIHTNREEGTILCFLPGWEDIYKVQALIPIKGNLMVVCLHSRLQDADQWKIFQPSIPGVRKLILTTDIAETSITISDVVYVIDSGVHKDSRFDDKLGVVCLDNQWISQASMIQRKGRAGRVQAGQSFHLYTKSKFDSMSKFSDPEILKISLAKIVLDFKAFYGGGDAWEFMNELPTPPRFETVKKAVEELKSLKLLHNGENLTALGKILAHFQMHPKLAKTLVNAVIFKCVTPVIDIVTICSSETSMFNNVLSDRHLLRDLKSKTGFKNSDHVALMMLYEHWLQLLEEQGENTAKYFCYDANLNHNSLMTIQELRRIHYGYVENGLCNLSVPISDQYSDNNELVTAVLFAGLGKVLLSKNYQKKNIFITGDNHETTVTSESVNFKKTMCPSNFLMYISEIRSTVRKINIVRECSAMSALAVLLFSSEDLTLNKINNKETVVGLKNTVITFLCTNEEATELGKCKTILNSFYQYNIHQLTHNGQFDPQIGHMWDKILEYINKILLKNSVL